MKYRVRPHEVEAFCYGMDPEPEWFVKCVQADWAIPGQTGVILRTTHHTSEFVTAGSWVVRGYNGIPHGVHADDFERIYKPCE